MTRPPDILSPAIIRAKSSDAATPTAFKFHNLEITTAALIMHFFEDKTAIPLNEIDSYRLEWHLHEPIFAKKWWFLVLTVFLKSGGEESGPIAFIKFNYVNDDREVRHDIEHKISDAISCMLSR